ncbi:MAG TPA: hypothetical protein VFE17_05285 [Candidatus Baltobacteraceae bacterium]|nr:hypothetical protein [Candidatus Baltobacteraceae bacterium]
MAMDLVRLFAVIAAHRACSLWLPFSAVIPAHQGAQKHLAFVERFAERLSAAIPAHLWKLSLKYLAAQGSSLAKRPPRAKVIHRAPCQEMVAERLCRET